MTTLRPRTAAVAAVLALLTSSLFTACTPVSSSGYEGVVASVDCGSLLDTVVERVRVDATAGALNVELDALSDSCADEYDIATDYFSLSSGTAQFGIENCSYWDEFRMRSEAIGLLREDGLCIDEAAPSVTESSWPEGGVGWNSASDHVGSYQRVCGPLMSVRGGDYGVFVNIGQDYPSADRFAFVIWGDWWLDPMPLNATICGVGTVYLYEGVTQMELGHPSELEIWQ